MAHRRLTTIALASLLGIAAACSSSPTAPANQPNTVFATNSLVFSPSTLTVAAGTTVTFTFQGVGHNVFFSATTGAPADIPTITSNASVTRTFNTPGSFVYQCHVHAGMQGTVVVQ